MVDERTSKGGRRSGSRSSAQPTDAGAGRPSSASPRAPGESTTRRRSSSGSGASDSTASSPTGSRRLQREADRARRRRLRRRRVALAVAILAVALAAALGLTRVLGGDEPPSSGEEAAGDAVESTTPVARADAYLAWVTEQGELAAALVVSPSEPALLLGMPGSTLVRGSEGFASLAELHAAEDPEPALQAVADLTGILPEGVVSAEWSDLQKALDEAGIESEEPADLAPAAAETGGYVAEALGALGRSASQGGEAGLNTMVVEGDAEGFKDAVIAVAGSGGTIEALPGRAVEGLDYRYFEPDPDAVARLLGGTPSEEQISVEVQNGSGVVGVAQRVSDLIAPLGYTMLPVKNADAFPDVETTQIYAGSSVLAEADRLRGLLGMGKVVQQDTLPPMQIIVVVGKDLDPEGLPAPTDGQ